MKCCVWGEVRPRCYLASANGAVGTVYGARFLPQNMYIPLNLVNSPVVYFFKLGDKEASLEVCN